MQATEPPHPAPFLIRPAEPRDGDAIAEVHTASMREALPYLPELHTDEETRAWVAKVVLPHQEVWVAEAGGRVVGVASIDADDMLTRLYILPGEQGRGIGSALLAKAMARRPDGIRLYVFQRNTRARGFYERRGFIAVAFGDGAGNEEGEPDVLYQWTPARKRLIERDRPLRLVNARIIRICSAHRRTLTKDRTYVWAMQGPID